MSRKTDTAGANPKEHAWALLLTAQAALVEEIEAALVQANLPPLAWYDLLWELEKAEGGKLRMHELARRVVLSRSNLSRLADRIENAGLIERVDSPGDGRGYDCVITRAGLAMRKKMWPVYSAAIKELFEDHIAEREAARMGESLRRILDAVRNKAGDD